MKRLEKGFVILGLQALLVLVMLHGSWSAPFHTIDDRQHLHTALDRPWTSWFQRSISSMYFPVTLFSYWVDYSLFSIPSRHEWDVRGTTGVPPVAQAADVCSAPAMRRMNGLYHLLGGFLLWSFLRRLGVGAGLAAFVALAWTGHPMACESVCWISERKNVLTALFGFGALLAWTVPRERFWRIPLVSVLYLLAVLSKPSALGLLPVFVMLELLYPQGAPACHERDVRGTTGVPPVETGLYRTPRFWLSFAGRLLLPALITAGGIFVTLSGFQLEIVTPPGGSVFTALLTDTEIFSRYVRQTLFPIGLSFFYGVEPVTSLGDWRVWVYGLLLMGFFGALVWAAGRERRRLALLGVLWFLGALGPSANIVAIPFWMQDRYVYLASAGLLLAVAAAAAGLAARYAQGRAVLPCVAIPAVAALTVLTALRSPLFGDEARLVVDAGLKQPNSAIACLEAAHFMRQEYVRHAATGPQPDRELAKAAAEAALGFYNNAVRCPDSSLQIDPFTLNVRRAELLLGLGRFEEAREMIGPLPPPGLVPLPETTPDGRRAHYARGERSRGYQPHMLAAAWLIMGETYLRQSGDTSKTLAAEQRMEMAEKAREAAERSVAVHPMNGEGYIMQARALIRGADLLAEQHKMPEALKRFEAGMAVLKSLPASSPSYKLAQAVIAGLPPPQEPKN
ncbi:MAG: hypothetical protein NTW87_21330 [Planctomycetota bacterium]|nr:hypothetical protein [Planctomycetota bacterium]